MRAGFLHYTVFVALAAGSASAAELSAADARWVLGGFARASALSQTLTLPAGACANGPLAPPERPRDSPPLVQEISETRAKELFTLFQSMGNLSTRYPEDGCFARALLMARILEEYGIHSRQVFIHHSLRLRDGEMGGLVLRTEYAERGFAQWGYHVAPVVRVRRADGSRAEWILDPSVLSEPGTFDDWRGRMSGETCPERPPTEPLPKTCFHYYTERYQYGPPIQGREFATGWDELALAHAQQTMEQYLPTTWKREWERQDRRRREAEAR